MIKVAFYERYHDVAVGFFTTKIYNDWEYQNIIEDILEKDIAAVSIRKTS